MKMIPRPEGGERHFFLVLDSGEEFPGAVLEFAARHQIGACQFTAVGGFSDADLAYFDWDRKQYLPIEVPEQVEVLSLMGNLTFTDGAPTVHAHAVLSRRDGSTLGGHLKGARVRPTLELMVTELPAGVLRSLDSATGLMLISPSRISSGSSRERRSG